MSRDAVGPRNTFDVISTLDLESLILVIENAEGKAFQPESVLHRNEQPGYVICRLFIP
jgi:hypothetical protein